VSSAAQIVEVGVLTGSFVVERYVYGRPRQGGTGVQWLAEVVGEDANLWSMGAFKTRRDALDAIDKHGTAAARNAHD
jgi:hypothetical protein